jgi:hypothetical protein
MPISRIMLDTELSPGMMCETSDDRPVAAPTADSASSSGAPAAMIAPNAMSRMISVTGSEKVPATPRSLATWLFTALFTDTLPASTTFSPGKSRCTCAVAACSGFASWLDEYGSPVMVTVTSIAFPSREYCGGPTDATCGRCMRWVMSAATRAACPWSSVPDGADTSTFSVLGWSSLALCTTLAACPAWPLAVSSCVAWCSPAALPPTTHTATNSSHSPMVRHGCVADQRAIRSVTGARLVSRRGDDGDVGDDGDDGDDGAE